MDKFVGKDSVVGERAAEPLSKPRPFYLAVAEMDGLAVATFDKWKKGEYRYVTQSRRRVLLTAVRLWLKAMDRTLPVPEVPKPSGQTLGRHGGRAGAGNLPQAQNPGPGRAAKARRPQLAQESGPPSQ